MTVSPDSTRPARLRAEYRVVGTWPQATLGEPLLLRVLVRNTGTASWPNRGAHPVNLAYHWLDSDGQVVDFDGPRAALPKPLAPDESAELDLLVEPPPAAGDYLLALDMVEEGRAWFSLQGAAPLAVPVTVVAAEVEGLRVCIICQICLINDAIGNHVLNQAQLLRSWGCQAQVLVEVVDQRQPAELRRLMASITYDDLRDGRETPGNRRALRSFQFADMYIFHYPVHYPLFEAIKLVERGIVFLDYHGITPPHLWDAAGKEYERLLEGQRKLALVRYADYAIAHSSYTHDELLRTGAIPPERIYQMHYPVGLDRFRPGERPRELALRYGLAEDQPVLLYVGRMAANKRVADLVRALPLIRDRHPGAVLLLVGDNRTDAYAAIVQDVRTLALELGMADHVIFTGQVPDDELAAHFQLADVYVTASLHEGFCIPVIEAMACGTPVVGTNATALPETIGDAGLTFRPEEPADLASKVLEILDSRAECRLTTGDRQRVIREV